MINYPLQYWCFFMSCRKTTASIVARLAAISFTLSSTGVALADSVVSIPDFQYEVLKKHTAKDDEEPFSSLYLPRTLQLRRAKNLLAAGHYEEAIREYSQGASEWKAPMQYRAMIDKEWGIACEKLGKNEEALQHYKTAGAKQPLARLLFKLERYAEVKAIADLEILDCIVSETKYPGSDFSFPQWLRLRAAAEEKLDDDKSAISDLELAAKKYFPSNSVEAELCINEANLLIARSQEATPLKAELLELPQEGLGKVIGLVNYLASSPEPFNISKINEFTGGHLKVPGSIWAFYSDDTKPSIPFTKLEYTADHDNYHLPQSLNISTSINKCCVPKNQIDKILPVSTKKLVTFGHFDSRMQPQYDEVYELKTGSLKFEFGESGARVLKRITLKALLPKEVRDECRSRLEADQKQQNEKTRAQSSLSERNESDDHVVDQYLKSSQSCLRLKRFDQALADIKEAVRLGGRPYLSEQSIIEEQIGKVDDAIEHLKSFIGNHSPGPETAKYFTRLADLYLQQKNYEESISACQKAMIGSCETAPAIFTKAKAEMGLNRVSEAQKDANTAAKEYFDKAEIVHRDEVLNWLKELPTH